MSTLRIATLNIWHDRGPWPQRLRMIRAELERLSPAVIGLQEVLRRRGVAPTVETCQATAIARDLGYTVAYGPATDVNDTLQQGNTLLSRLPIRRQRVLRLPGEDRAEPRSLLYALVETSRGEVPVFVTHLSWEPDHGPLRCEQASFIAARVAELASIDGPALPSVLLGDFNAEPETDEMKLLRGADGQGGPFLDAWTFGGDGSAGVTFDPANDYAREADEPGRRIDYILLQRHDELPQVHTALAFNTPETSGDTPVWPSDHFGLVSDVILS